VIPTVGRRRGDAGSAQAIGDRSDAPRCLRDDIARTYAEIDPTEVSPRRGQDRAGMHDTNTQTNRAGRLHKVELCLVAAVVALVAVAGFEGGSATGDSASAVGQAPPEWAANGGSWPAHNYDLANTRATVQTAINSQTVSHLRVKWRFGFKGASAFGIFASTPIALNGTVYLQDLNSNVYALDGSTGRVEWRHAFNKPSIGPNGVAFGNGRIYGATETDAFALDAQTGSLLWSRKLIRNNREGIDMTSQLYDDTVLISTIPGQRLVLLQGRRARCRVGARCCHRQAQVDLRHGLRRRRAVRQSEG
jgi:hypothetical protein